ncbi:MAG: hypothetical protein E2O44_07950 [Nitrospina sp.]|nr:MAG: hypothetical protein E2O44_07950 [Nitrospina sp.]TDJ60605.1 MAG: hypothetical protein E2O41_02050 [Nitrospina sp.]
MRNLFSKFLLILLLLTALALHGCGRKGPPVPPAASTPSGHEAYEGISHVTLDSTGHTPLALNNLRA